MSQDKTTGTGADVSYFFESLLRDLHEWAGRMSKVFESHDGAPGPQDLDAAIHPLVNEFLDRKELPLVGAGFVAARDALAGTPWHMAWWQGPAKERLLMLTIESAGETYSRREWFTVPMESGEGHVTGPYVDFLCTDEYTLTLTVPVTARGTIVGVAGADVLVETIELLLMDRLKDIDPRATLVNGSGRVIVSADPQLAAGALLVRGWQGSDAANLSVADKDLGFDKVAVGRCGTLPLAIAVPA